MRLKAKKHMKHNNTDYRPGETFDVHDQRQAQGYIDSGHAEHVDTEAGEAQAAQAEKPPKQQT